MAETASFGAGIATSWPQAHDYRNNPGFPPKNKFLHTSRHCDLVFPQLIYLEAQLNKLQKLEDALIKHMLTAADMGDRGDKGDIFDRGWHWWYEWQGWQVYKGDRGVTWVTCRWHEWQGWHGWHEWHEWQGWQGWYGWQGVTGATWLTGVTGLTWLTGLTGPKFENGITHWLTGLTCRDACASKKTPFIMYSTSNDSKATYWHTRGYFEGFPDQGVRHLEKAMLGN